MSKPQSELQQGLCCTFQTEKNPKMIEKYNAICNETSCREGV